MSNIFAIIEIGSNNTKTHIYKDEDLIYENNITIEFKKNYKEQNKLMKKI
ncbi:unknown [Clostridium sp. CAG:389]|nr:unknown [Clostridium sp. CAG:389]